MPADAKTFARNLLSRRKIMKFRALLKPSVVAVVVAVAVFAALIGVCSPSRVDDKLDAASDYMRSENLALGAEASSDGMSASALTDGKSSTSYTARRKSGSEFLVDLGEETPFNTVILKEDGLNVKSFELFASSDGENYSRIFASDKIEYHRLCSVDPTSARFLRLVINESDDLASIKEIEVYDELPRDSSSFRTCGYVSGSWLGTAEDTSVPREERKAAILADMSRYDMDMLTHVFYYCGGGFTADGTVYFGSPDLSDAERTAKEEGLALALECIREACGGDVKISLTLGISTGSPAANPAMDDNREVFISNLIAVMDRFGFDGIDIDYEFPITDYDYEVFSSFLVTLKERMPAESDVGDEALLSCAFGTRDINYGEEVWDALDFVNVMTYDIADQDGYHSSFWGCGPQAGVYFESIGLPREKINLGIPFYGTQIHALMEQYIYADLQEHDYFRNIYYCLDYLGKEKTPVYFNSPSMVRDKTAYAFLSGMGGVMVWHMTADADYSSEYSLWRAIHTALDIYGGER